MTLTTENIKTETGLKTEEMILNMGPQHPSTHGVLRFELHLEGEIITKVIPHIGYFIVVLKNMPKQ